MAHYSYICMVNKYLELYHSQEKSLTANFKAHFAKVVPIKLRLRN